MHPIAHLEEILSLNAEDLDVEELERRLEMSPIVVPNDGCTTLTCNCHCGSNGACCGCYSACAANCGTNCGTLYGCGRLECSSPPASGPSTSDIKPNCI